MNRKIKKIENIVINLDDMNNRLSSIEVNTVKNVNKLNENILESRKELNKMIQKNESVIENNEKSVDIKSKLDRLIATSPIILE